MSGSRRPSAWHESANADGRDSAERATDREVGVVPALLVAGSEKVAAHRLGLSHSTLKHHLTNARSKVGAMTAKGTWRVWRRLPSTASTTQCIDGKRSPRCH